jgi:hypothetical protein
MIGSPAISTSTALLRARSPDHPSGRLGRLALSTADDVFI